MAGGPGGNEVGRISIRVVPDTSRFRAELRAQLEAIENSMKAKIPVELDLDKNGIREKVKAATAGLDSHAKVHVDVDVDRNRIQRSLASVKDSISSLFDKIPTKGGGGGFPLGAFADNFVLVAAVASIAAPALALLTGALAALPAVLAGIATPIGVIALGLDGIKKAATVLQEPLGNLKKSISGVFETRLTPVFDQLAQAMPKLEGPLKAVANGISDVAQSFVNAITSGPGLKNIQDTIGNIATAISDAAPGIGSLSNGLLGLANNVSAKFPAVSKWFNEAADSFSRWVDKATADGSLDRAMGNLGDTLKGVLDIVGDIAKQGFDWLQDPNFGKAMTDFVNNTKTLVNDVLPGLGGLFEQISGALDGIVPILDRIDKWQPPSWLRLNEKGRQQDNGFGAFPGMENPNKGKPPGWLDKLESGQFITETTNSMQATIAVLEGQLISLWARIKLGFSQAWTETVTSFQASMLVLQGIAQTAWNTIVQGVTTAFSGVLNTLNGFNGQIISFFANIPNALASAWSSLGSIASSAWQAVVSAVQSALQQAVSAVVSGAAQIVAEVVAIGSKVAAAAANFGSILVGAGRALIQGLINGIKGMAGAAIAAARDIASQVANAAKGALGIHSPSKVFTEIGAQTAQGLQNGLEGGFAGVIERAKALSQQLTDAVNGGLAGVDQGKLSEGIKKQLDELELERKTLKTQYDAIPKEDKEGRKALQGQMDQIKTLKDQLGLQSDQLGFSQKYGNQLDDNNKTQDMLGQSLTKMVDIGKGFAEANIKQFESDIGISGNGAIPQLAEQGLSWLSSTLGHLITTGLGGGTQIHVNSVDDALAAKQTLDNKKALQFVGR